MSNLYMFSGFIDEHSEKLFTGDIVKNEQYQTGVVIFRYGRYQVKYDNYYTDLADEHDVLIHWE